MKYLNRKTNIPACNYHTGDFALVFRDNRRGYKRFYEWVGPMRVVSAKSAHVFEIEDLVLRRREVANGLRFLLYLSYMDGKSVGR